jgi:hypothetical protein
MIALLSSGSYFIDSQENVKDFLISYAKYIGFDMKVFGILANSGEMSVQELIEYINNHCWSGDDAIDEIYEIGKKHY